MNGITLGNVFAMIAEIDRGYDMVGRVHMNLSDEQIAWDVQRDDLLLRIMRTLPGHQLKLDHRLSITFDNEISGIAEQYGVEIFQSV